VLYQLSLKWREQDWECVNDYLLATKARVMIFYTAQSQRMTVGCITKTWNWKPSHFNIIISLLPGRGGGKKRERDNLLLESAYLQFSVTTEVSFTSSTWSKVYKNKLQCLHEDPKKGWKNESFTFVWGKKPVLLQCNVRPHNNASTSGVTREHQIQCCFTHSLQPRFGTFWVLVVCSSQETCRGNSIYMWWWSFSCYGKWLQGQPTEFYNDCSEKLVHRWQHCIKLEAHYMEKWAIEIKCIFCVIFCFVSFRCFLDVKIWIWKCSFLKTWCKTLRLIFLCLIFILL